MATFLGSPAFLAYPVIPKPTQLSCTSQSPPPPPPPPPRNQQQPTQFQFQSQPEPQPPPQPQPQSSSSSSSSSSSPSLTSSSSPSSSSLKPQQKKLSADTTDWVASSLTRRFGLGAGLAWVAFLAAGVISEQIKTRFEASQQQANTKDVEKEEEVVLPNGIRYYEMRVGGGDSPRPGDLVVIDLKGRVVGKEGGGGGGDVFVDTFGEGERPLALVMGSRPYTRGMCEGVEYALRSMRAGGKRRVLVPQELGFGDDGADFGSGVRVPPGATLEFVVQVDKVSIAPS